MGNFSWDCNVCGRSLRGSRINRAVAKKAWGCDAVLVPSRGERMEGDYDGYGRVGGTPIPDAWDDEYGPYLRREIQQARERLDRLAGTEAAAPFDVEVRPDDPPFLVEMRSFLRNLRDERARSLAESEARLKKIEPTEVQFTAYHRRCWEAAGRPSFRGQSPRSLDQGNW